MAGRQDAAVSEELDGAVFGDARLSRRLKQIAERVSAAPSQGFPQVVANDSELEGVYRFLRNRKVNAERILAPHEEATWRRAGDQDILVVHDSTGFVFGGSSKRQGLGYLHNQDGAQAFLGHFALAVAADGSRKPLGLLGLRTWTRQGKPIGRSLCSRKRQKRPNKESDRWAELAIAIHTQSPKTIHVMDREAGSYQIFDEMLQAGARFVVRIREAHTVLEESGRRVGVAEAAKRSEALIVRSVPLSARPKSKMARSNKIHPPRAERSATLEIRATTISLPRPRNFTATSGLPSTIQLNLVNVSEVGAPRNAVPVSWFIVTTEPISTAKEVESIVDAYRARWTIEEFFKALKTGCAFEKRQLESFHALRNTLAIFSVIAWRLLLLRTTARSTPTAAASSVLTRNQTKLLKTLSRMQDPSVPKLEMSAKANASEALLVVARLGGHIKNNGPPGWQVLGRGYERLLLLELGWRVAQEM